VYDFIALFQLFLMFSALLFFCALSFFINACFQISDPLLRSKPTLILHLVIFPVLTVFWLFAPVHWPNSIPFVLLQVSFSIFYVLNIVLDAIFVDRPHFQAVGSAVAQVAWHLELFHLMSRRFTIFNVTPDQSVEPSDIQDDTKGLVNLKNGKTESYRTS
jgi:hypothetical protein